MAWHGEAGQGEAGFGEDSLSWWRYANLRLWHGMMVQGFAGQGSARQGKDSSELVAVPQIVKVWQSKARRGEAGQGPVRSIFLQEAKMKFSDELQPGQSITQAEIESATGQMESTDPQAFALLLLRVRGDLITHLKRQHGRELTVRIVKGDLHILDDREAADYNPKRYAQGLRIARRAHRRLMAVDVSKLSPQEREQHTQTVCRQASALSSLRARPEISVAASTRPESPKLMAGKK